jgi:MoaA/NifB/PqqE/SkfB family radical SAM enzyme
MLVTLKGLSRLRQARALARTKRFPSVPEVGWNFARYNCVLPLRGRPFLPRALLLYVTYRCNARCVMCGIWQDHEFADARSALSLSELERVLSDRLFAAIEYLNINGGEPALRADLAEVVRLCLDKLPRLRHLSLNSNGLLTDRLVEATRSVLADCTARGIPFSLVIATHAAHGLLDEILGVPGAFVRQEATIAALRALDGQDTLSLSLNCVITNRNAGALDRLRAWCAERRLPVNFILGEVRDRFFNREMADDTLVSAEQKKETVAFLRHLAADRSLANPAAYRYHRLAGMLERGARRGMACHYAMGGLILGSHGDLYYCSHSRSIGNCRQRSAYDVYFDPDNLAYRQRRLLRDECAHCPPNTFNRLEFQKDLLRFVAFLSRSHPSSSE